MPRKELFQASDGTVIPLVPRPYCRFCSDPIADEFGGFRQCGKCTNRLKELWRTPAEGPPNWDPANLIDVRVLRPFAFDRALAVGIYPRDTPGRGNLGARILALKRDGEGCASLVESMAFVLESRYDGTPFDLMVPHPPSPGKAFAPTRLLAEGLAEPLNLEVLDALRLDARYLERGGADLASRFARAEGMHQVDHFDEIQGANILLIDDVLTSCGNAHWAAEALQAAGASSVTVLVLGRTVGAEHLNRIGYDGPL